MNASNSVSVAMFGPTTMGVPNCREGSSATPLLPEGDHSFATLPSYSMPVYSEGLITWVNTVAAVVTTGRMQASTGRLRSGHLLPEHRHLRLGAAALDDEAGPMGLISSLNRAQIAQRMHMLKKIGYLEFQKDPRYWELEPCDFVEKNLVVGRNATGKSRLMSVINGLCMLLSGKRTDLFESGSYDVQLEIQGRLYALQLSMQDSKVISEKLTVDGELRLERSKTGAGRIYYEKERAFLDFLLPDNMLALQQRRDELQHPFVAEVGKWAQNCLFFAFGSALGKQTLQMVQQGQVFTTSGPIEQHVVSTYIDAWTKFGEKFDKAIIKDMGKLGYDISDVGVQDLRTLSPHAKAPDSVVSLFVKETDRDANVGQIDMSQGMFRALALVVAVNSLALKRFKGLVLIDDIGEGLDHERAVGLIDVLFVHAKNGIQLIATTNDRFVMNRVPLEHWCLLRRDGAKVKAFTQRNSEEAFKEFEFVGLSNFEFFKSNLLH